MGWSAPSVGGTGRVPTARQTRSNLYRHIVRKYLRREYADNAESLHSLKADDVLCIDEATSEMVRLH